MTKIMHIISDTNIGGAGNLLLNYLAAYDRKSFEQHVVLPSGSMLLPRLKTLDVTIHETVMLRDKSLDLKAIPELRRVIRTVRPDIVHTHGALSGRIAARLCGRKIVFTRHSAFPPSPRTTRGIGKLLFKTINEWLADAIIAVGPVCADALFACGISQKRVFTFFNGVLPIQPRTDDEKSALRPLYGINDGDFVASIIARIEPYKGQMTVVDAAAELARQDLYPKIIIAGTGGQESDVRARARELGVTENVIFAGFVSDVEGLLAINDVQINASTVEASSLSLLEGMSAGIPAAVSNTSGNPFIIDDGENGLLFEVENPTALAAVLRRYMTEPELRQKIGVRAREIYEERFTARRLAADTEKVYKHLTEDRK